jgi:hypothetical protein
VNLEHKTGTPQASEWPEDATCSRITANSILVAIKDREVRQPTKRTQFYEILSYDPLFTCRAGV